MQQRNGEIKHGTLLQQLDAKTVDAFLFRDDFALTKFGFVQRTFEPEHFFISDRDSCDTMPAPNLADRLAAERAWLNLSVRPETHLRSVFGAIGMSGDPDFRAWAARLEIKAGDEPDPEEFRRLMSIADYWKRLADLDDWERDGFRASDAKSHQRLS
jgi:hypothetical protein